MTDSKFLKKEDAGDGILVTIKGVEKRDVGTESDPEQKWVLLLEECKPLVLNSTNLALLEKATGSDDSDDWTGKQVVLFNDENVSFGGKLTGGVRVDVARTKRNASKGNPGNNVFVGGAREGARVDPNKLAARAAIDEDDRPF